MLDAIQTLANSSNLRGLASTKQVAVINRILAQQFPERSDRLAFLKSVFGHRFNSSNDLTKAEASALISYMYIDNWEVNPYWEDFVKERTG